MNGVYDQKPASISGVKSPWVWGVAALVGSTLAANVAMVYFAVSTSPGLVVENYYERGQSFENRSRLEFTRRRELGWSFQMADPAGLQAGSEGVFRAMIAGPDGKPVNLDSVTLNAYRPSDAGADFAVKMAGTDGGAYEAKVSFPLRGVWDIIIVARKGEDHQDFARRIFVEDGGGR